MPFKFHPHATRTAADTRAFYRRLEVMRSQGLDESVNQILSDEAEAQIVPLATMSDADLADVNSELGGEYSAMPQVQQAFVNELARRGMPTRRAQRYLDGMAD